MSVLVVGFGRQVLVDRFLLRCCFHRSIPFFLDLHSHYVVVCLVFVVVLFYFPSKKLVSWTQFPVDRWALFPYSGEAFAVVGCVDSHPWA